MCLLAIRLHNCVNRGKDIKKIDATKVRKLEIKFSPVVKGKEKYANITYSYIYDQNADGEEIQQEKDCVAAHSTDTETS